MTTILGSLLTAYLIAFLIIPVIIKYTKKKRILDVPGRRKIHKDLTPSMGGLAIFAGFIAGALFWMPLQGFSDFKYALGGLLVIFLTGFRDDIVPLKPHVKLLAQIFAAGIVVVPAGIRITSLYGLFGIDALPVPLDYLISIFVIIVITNSFNLIDGLDGLAGTVASIILSFFGTWFFLAGEEAIAIYCFCFLGAILAFLYFNWQPSKIFMGDTGALLLGFFFSILAIYFMEANHQLSPDDPLKFNAVVTTAMAVIIIPLFDTLRIFILRLSKGISPFTPDKNHMHHALMRMGMSHAYTAITLGSLNLTFIGLILIFRDQSDFIMLPALLVVSTALSLTLDFFIIRKVSTRG